MQVKMSITNIEAAAQQIQSVVIEERTFGARAAVDRFAQRMLKHVKEGYADSTTYPGMFPVTEEWRRRRAAMGGPSDSRPLYWTGALMNSIIATPVQTSQQSDGSVRFDVQIRPNLFGHKGGRVTNQWLAEHLEGTWPLWEGVKVDHLDDELGKLANELDEKGAVSNLW